jgi:hypothetical protein
MFDPAGVPGYWYSTYRKTAQKEVRRISFLSRIKTCYPDTLARRGESDAINSTLQPTVKIVPGSKYQRDLVELTGQFSAPGPMLRYYCVL